MFWADVKAREGQFSITSEIYSFALCVFYIIYEKPLYSEANKQEYLDNKKRVEEGEDFELLKMIINQCLDNNPENRPGIVKFGKEI